MVATYKTREEKTYAVIQSLVAGPDSEVVTVLVNKNEHVFHDLNDLEAGFIFLTLENKDYVVKKFFKKEIKNNDESNGKFFEEVSAGDDSEGV